MRTNAQAAVIAEAFTQRRIPHRVRGGGDLMQQPEVRQAIGALRRSTSLQMALGDLEAEVLRLAPPGTTPPTPWQGARRTVRSLRRCRAARPQLTEERAANLNELVRLGREYLALDPARRRARLPRMAHLRAARRGPLGRRRRGDRHLPRGQGPGVVDRAPRRSRGGLRPDPPRQGQRRRPGRGAPPALRRAHPGPRRAALHVGGIAHVRLTHRQALALTVAADHRRRRSASRRIQVDRRAGAERARAARASLPAQGPQGPARRRPRAVRGAARLAAGTGQGGRRRRVRDLQRRHADRRSRPHGPATAPSCCGSRVWVRSRPSASARTCSASSANTPDRRECDTCQSAHTSSITMRVGSPSRPTTIFAPAPDVSPAPPIMRILRPNTSGRGTSSAGSPYGPTRDVSCST